MGQVELLYRLQQIDTEARQKKQRLGEVLRAQKETEALAAARRRAEAAASEWRKWQARRKNLAVELDNLNNKAKRSEERLYSGNVKNPKELTDLQNEIEALGRRRVALEDDMLEAMIMGEDAQAEKEAADEALAQIEAEWRQLQVGLQREQNELALRLNDLANVRQQQLRLIVPKVLSEYEEIGRRRHGVAVAGLKGNMCLGCQLTVSANTVKEAVEGKLVYCSSCGRVLHPL